MGVSEDLGDILCGLAKYSVVHGEALAVLAELPDACVDGVVTDMPYSSGGQFRGDRVGKTGEKYQQRGDRDGELPDFAGDTRDQRSFSYWCALWLSECLRVAKAGSVLCAFTDWRQLPSVTDAIQAGGWVWRGIVPWDKTEASRPRMGGFRSQCEFVVWATAGELPPRTEVGCLPGLIRAAVPRDRVHQTEKPIQALQVLVGSTPPGGIVLDPFAGSGTTGMAALQLGRRFIGIERVAHYAALSRERLEAASAGHGRADLGAFRAGQVGMFAEPMADAAPPIPEEPPHAE